MSESNNLKITHHIVQKYIKMMMIGKQHRNSVNTKYIYSIIPRNETKSQTR